MLYNFNKIVTSLAIMIITSLPYTVYSADFALPKVYPAVPGYTPIYSDRGAGGSFSVVDRESYAEMQKRMAGFVSDLKMYYKYTDAVVRKNDAKNARYALDYLTCWAEGGHMLSEPSGTPQEKNQSHYEMKWALQGLATSYALELKRYATPRDCLVIETWMIAAAKKVAAFNIVGAGDSKLNNHYYWGGASVMAVAVATGNEELLKLAEKTYKAGIDEICDDGSLPREMKRKQQALHYHGFAMTPLVFMAELSKCAGKNWYAYKPERLKLLGGFIIRNMKDPSLSEKTFGIAQDYTLMTPCSDDREWMHFWGDRSQVAQWCPEPGQCMSRTLGGDIGMMIEKGFWAK